MLYTFFPEILALIPVIKVEFHRVLVVALQKWKKNQFIDNYQKYMLASEIQYYKTL